MKAGGNLGPAIVDALVSSGFDVTVISRSESSSTFPPSVRVENVDYNSEAELANAVKGQDAIVSTIATPALPVQQKIIDAAVKAGVKRFIPSEFGINTTKIDGGVAKILTGKIQVQEQLKKAATENKGFSWTGVSTNLFFDWVSLHPAF